VVDPAQNIGFGSPGEVSDQLNEVHYGRPKPEGLMGSILIPPHRKCGPSGSTQATRCAHVEPGITLGGLDRETQALGLATPTGINSTTGIAGLILGGGFGWITRKVDNLVSAGVADGLAAAKNSRSSRSLTIASSKNDRRIKGIQHLRLIARRLRLCEDRDSEPAYLDYPDPTT
jgi:FAD binding domain